MTSHLLTSYCNYKFLEGLSFFEGIDDSVIMAVADMASMIHVKPDNTFYCQGDSIINQYLLISGEVKIGATSTIGEQTIMRYVGPGEAFGGLLYETFEENPVTAIAVKKSTALFWNCSEFRQILMEHPRLSVNLISLLGLEFSLIRNRFQELATQRVEQRVARALIRLVDHAGIKIDGGILIDFPLSRQNLAELTGTTLFSVSRILTRWEKLGILELGRMKICIRNQRDLMVFAEDLNSAPDKA